MRRVRVDIKVKLGERGRIPIGPQGAASATFVSGATATSVTSPGAAMISRMIASTACSLAAGTGESGSVA
jgi:hypothetical protein